MSGYLPGPAALRDGADDHRFHPYPPPTPRDSRSPMHGMQGAQGAPLGMHPHLPRMSTSSATYYPDPRQPYAPSVRPSHAGPAPPAVNGNGLGSLHDRVGVDSQRHAPRRDLAPAPFQPVATADVERLAGRYGANAAKLLAFNNLPPGHQMLEIFALLLHQEDTAEARLKLLQSADAKLAKLDTRIVENFKPSKAIVEHMRRVVRYYLFYPVNSYHSVHIHASNYYVTRAAEKHPLAKCGYLTDPTIKDAIHKELEKLAGQARGQLRSLVWRMVEKQTALSTWVTHMSKHWDARGMGQTSTPTKQKQARLALMREVAAPLVPRATSKGQDTGFWSALSKKLDALYAAHGPDINSVGWDRWADDIIARDKLLYKQKDSVEHVDGFGTDNDDGDNEEQDI